MIANKLADVAFLPSCPKISGANYARTQLTQSQKHDAKPLFARQTYTISPLLLLLLLVSLLLPRRLLLVIILLLLLIPLLLLLLLLLPLLLLLLVLVFVTVPLLLLPLLLLLLALVLPTATCIAGTGRSARLFCLQVRCVSLLQSICRGDLSKSSPEHGVQNNSSRLGGQVSPWNTHRPHSVALFRLLSQVLLCS